MWKGSIRLVAISIPILFLVLSIIHSPVSGQNESLIINEIAEDWPTDIVLIYVETPNKYDRSYGTNITDRAVLDEISEIEERINPNRDDKGDDDSVVYVLSISTLIKEINQAPSNVWEASIEEFNPLVDPGPFPGDSEYVIPEDQDDIDQIVEGMPSHIVDLFVRDTNNDRIWDSAIIWIGTSSGSQSILNRIDRIIDRYNVDPQVDESHFNSKNNWWQRIETGEIHCQMSNLGYVKSSEEYYGADFIIGTVFTIMVLFIIITLTVITIMVLIFRRKKEKEKQGSKKNLLIALTVFGILISANLLIATINTQDPNLEKYDNFSSEFAGGQVGLIAIIGNHAPPDDEPFIGSGSMKDIEVLDNMERFESDLENIRDHDNPNENLNPPFTIIDLMKMIKVPESMVNQIPIELIPDSHQHLFEDILNSSFWEAIHTAGQIDNVLWYVRNGKSLQDTLINIFYKSITPELRWTFVNEDYSRSLFYLQLPIRETDQNEHLKGTINQVVSNHGPFLATSNVAFMSSSSGAYDNLGLMIKGIALFVILLVGILIFLLLISRALEFGKKENGEVLEVEEETIFPDITNEEETYYDDGSYYKPPSPPGFRP
jgi:hypothetical protein